MTADERARLVGGPKKPPLPPNATGEQSQAGAGRKRRRP
jgi:hypothetical protein